MPRTEYSQIFVLSESTGDGMLGLFRPGSAECPRIAPTPLSHFYAPWRLALDWTLGKPRRHMVQTMARYVRSAEFEVQHKLQGL
jgi:hypothetical protein